MLRGRGAVSDIGRAGRRRNRQPQTVWPRSIGTRGDRAGRETGLRISYARSNRANGEFNWLPQRQRQRYLVERRYEVCKARRTRFQQLKCMGRRLAGEGRPQCE
jgi:hypothetical protein